MNKNPWKEDFPALKQKVNGNQIIYFDNAATTLKPKYVVDKLSEFYLYHNANVHRGIHELSERSTELYESSRKKVADFIGANDSQEIVFTRNTTESINLLVNALGKAGMLKNKKVMITTMEHHSNFVPWQKLAKFYDFQVVYHRVKDGIFNINDFERDFLRNDIYLVSITGMSNLTGQTTPVKKIAEIVKSKNSLLVIDGAQLIPHKKVNVNQIGLDFLAFSGHKMLSPMGIGVIYIRKEFLEILPPFMYGGGMIDKVSVEETSFAEAPEKFEAGTPNVGGAVGLAAAIEYIEKLGFQNIENHIKDLTHYALEKLLTLDHVKILGPKDESHHSIISFVVDNVHPHDVSQFLNDRYAIATRSGHHCAQPLLREINVKATCRASFYLYNEKEEIDVLFNALKKIKEVF